MEFKAFNVGDSIECKVLSVEKDPKSDRSWVELTRQSKHMQKPQGLDESLIQHLLTSPDQLKVGQQYNAMVLSCSLEREEPVNLKFSQPIHL